MGTSYREIIFILDRSVSMQAIRSDAVARFNSFVEEQRRTSLPARMTLEIFDDQFRRIYEELPIEETLPLKKREYVPYGSSPLLDAIGRAMANAYIRIMNLPPDDRPCEVAVAVLTDAQENASIEFDYSTLAELIEKRRTQDGWKFIFLYADQSAIEICSRMTIRVTPTAG